jgi:hypothetical protein
VFFDQAGQRGLQARAGERRRLHLQQADVGAGQQQHDAAAGADQVAQVAQRAFALLLDDAAVVDEGEAAQRMFAFRAGGMPDIKCSQTVSLS